jgi:hypothetical protein
MDTALSLGCDVRRFLYVIGFPVLLFVILYRRRRTLYGPDSAQTASDYGFLYLTYGPTAPMWEIEELLRKLILSAVSDGTHIP